VKEDQPTRCTSCLSCPDVIAIPITPGGGPSQHARCADCCADFESPKHNHEHDVSCASSNWRRLSKALPREAGWLDCGTRQNLSLDHLPGSHECQAAERTVRPGIDVQVRCLPCSAKAGPTRPGWAHMRRSPK
jgi:hypothetical protein